MPHNNLVFSKYKEMVKYFVETGSYHGDGIQEALDSGFEKIISTEIFEDAFKICQERFKEDDRVKLIFGDSIHLLYDAIKDVNEPIMFWLDAHFSGASTGKGENPYPLLQELNQISKHQIKEHTILIDDLRLWNKGIPPGEGFPLVDFENDEIIKKILEINSEYKISYENGHVENDILVAKII